MRCVETELTDGPFGSSIIKASVCEGMSKMNHFLFGAVRLYDMDMIVPRQTTTLTNSHRLQLMSTNIHRLFEGAVQFVIHFSPAPW